MDSIKDTLADMMEMFQKKMSDFDAELQKSNGAASTTSSLAADFAAFRAFITNALGNLQQQVQLLARSLDNLEMRGRRKMLLLHGVKEVDKEDPALLVANLIKSHLQIDDFTPLHIKRCHRLGRSTDAKKPRPIACKFNDVGVRDKIWFAKTKLKGSGITISEFLTKARHEVFMAARDKFGITKCWTQEGSVFVVGVDGARVRVASLQDVHVLDATKPPALRVKTAKPKRAVNTKK